MGVPCGDGVASTLVPDTLPNTVHIVALSVPLLSAFLLLHAGTDTGHLVTSVLCIFDVSVVGGSMVSTINR